jgi:hypothetical protein
MSQLRLLIKRPGRADTCIPVTVDDTDIIGNCISSLVDHLGLPRRDRLGRVLTYSLRPLSSGQPLSSTLRFADARLLPETRLVLEADDAKTVTQAVGTSMSGSFPARVPGAQPPVATSRQIVNRRTFVVGSILTGCAIGGLLTGMATALATRRPALPMTPPATPPPHVSAVLQQTCSFLTTTTRYELSAGPRMAPLWRVEPTMPGSCCGPWMARCGSGFLIRLGW